MLEATGTTDMGFPFSSHTAGKGNKVLRGERGQRAVPYSDSECDSREVEINYIGQSEEMCDG